MATITALTTQKRSRDRINIFLDGEFAFGLPAAAAMDLRMGQELSGREIAALQELDEVEKAKKIAIALISRRPRSTTEIERHLRQKQFDDLVISKVVERLTAVDLLDDHAFVDYWVDQRETFKPRSHLALRQELMQKGVSRDIIDSALENVNERNAALRAAAKKARRWQHLPEAEYRAKLSRYLQRLGFPYDIIRETTNRYWQALGEGEALDDYWPDIEGE
jgi:regulatory protein